MLAGMSGVPRVWGTQAIATCGRGSSSALVSTGGRWSRRSFASISATGPPRRISVERRQACLNAVVECDAAARAPGAVERRVAVVGLVHLGHQPHVGRLAVLGDAAVEAHEVAVALAAGDPERRDDLAGPVAVLRGDVEHQPRARLLGAAEDELVGAAELREVAHDRRLRAGLAGEQVERRRAGDAGEHLALGRQVGRRGGGRGEQREGEQREQQAAHRLGDRQA